MSALSADALSADDVDRFALRLDEATLAHRDVVMLTAEKQFGVDDGYAIQRAGVALRKLRSDDVVGMKMGLTSAAKMKQMGVSDPIYGHLTRAMALDDGGALSIKAHIHPKVEPEIAFLLGRDLAGPVTTA